MNLSHLTLDSPAAIAFSGGGDSTAMIHAFRDDPKVTHAFIIDHALRDESRAEVQHAAEMATSLGYIVRTKRWRHQGVISGVQAKARHYRYHALGDLCRADGLKHLITAHTADDQAETLLMRLDRQTGWRGLAGMRKQAFSPLWPALMGITLHRPWLDVSRAELRAYNSSQGLDFVDDPSNENRDYTRIRARQALSADQALRSDLLAQQKTALARLMIERQTHSDWLSRFAKISPHGFVETSSVPSPELLLHILNAVSGQGGPIDATKRERLATAMEDIDFSGTTLSGAWAKRTSHGFVFTRDMAAVRGRGAQHKITDIALDTGEARLWDGRFYVQALRSGVEVKPAFGLLQNLRQSFEFKAIFDFPSAVRPCLPIYKMEQKFHGFGGIQTKDINAVAVSAQRLQTFV